MAKLMTKDLIALPVGKLLYQVSHGGVISVLRKANDELGRDVFTYVSNGLTASWPSPERCRLTVEEAKDLALKLIAAERANLIVREAAVRDFHDELRGTVLRVTLVRTEAGWYGEVFKSEPGRPGDVTETDVAPRRSDARRLAADYCNRHHPALRQEWREDRDDR